MSESIEKGSTDRWVTGPQLTDYYGVSSMTIWRWCRDPKLCFPQPITIRRRNFWSMSALRAWERSVALDSAGEPIRRAAQGSEASASAPGKTAAASEHGEAHPLCVPK
jgi:predicted DNA-binding transcriptional regulator AlpA